jgi:S1/P1 Nuclease
MTLKKHRNVSAVVAMSIGLSPCLMAWNGTGHMTVAAVAWEQLKSTKLQNRVSALLKLNPDYMKWQAKIPAGAAPKDVPEMIFMIAATWPDEIKSEAGYTNDKTPTATNVGYSDKNQHRYWHYVDTPFAVDTTKLPAIPSPNAATQIKAFRIVLGSSQKDPLKSYDLVWLLHLVGDVHQPLHAATRVSMTMPKGDTGGNDVLCASPCPDIEGKRELHGYWDDLLGTNENPTSVLTAARSLPAANPAAVAIVDETKWIAESFQLAETDSYMNPPIAVSTSAVTLTPAYEATAKTVAQTQVALAGARLAALINANLK